MTTVTRTFTWSMGHRLLLHDGLCRFPHGHTYVADVTVEPFVRATPRRDYDGLHTTGPSTGMVLDFTALDAVVLKVLERWDHAFMVEEHDPLADVLLEFGRVVSVPWTPTAEHIAHELWRQVEDPLGGAGAYPVSVTVHEGPKSSATYRKGDA